MKKKTSTATALGIATAVVTAGATAIIMKNSQNVKRNMARKKAQRAIDNTVTAIGGAMDAISSTFGR